MKSSDITQEVLKEEPDFILIDNDNLVIKTWKFSAKQQGKNLLTFTSFDDAEKNIEKFSPQTPIYIDSDLGTDIPGEQCAKILYDKGFKNIYLTTGRRASHFKMMHWIKGIIGKEPRC